MEAAATTQSTNIIEYYTGVPVDYVVIGLAVLVCILIIVMLVNAVKFSKLKKAYAAFMEGNDGKSLEETLIDRLNEVDNLKEANASNERNIETLVKKSKKDIRKQGLIKYDALEQLGGKMSFALCMLDDSNNGFIINSVHSREGCYTYVKEIIDANSVIALAKEEEDALMLALDEGK